MARVRGEQRREGRGGPHRSGLVVCPLAPVVEPRLPHGTVRRARCARCSRCARSRAVRRRRGAPPRVARAAVPGLPSPRPTLRLLGSRSPPVRVHAMLSSTPPARRLLPPAPPARLLRHRPRRSDQLGPPLPRALRHPGALCIPLPPPCVRCGSRRRRYGSRNALRVKKRASRAPLLPTHPYLSPCGVYRCASAGNIELRRGGAGLRDSTASPRKT